MRIEDGQNKHTDDDDSNGEDEIQFQFKLRAEAKSIKHFLFALEQKLYLTSFVTKSRTDTDGAWRQAYFIFDHDESYKFMSMRPIFLRYVSKFLKLATNLHGDGGDGF